MQVHACEKVFVIVQAAAQFLVLILKALQWIISWILELVIVPTSWIWQDELHLHRASGIKPILEQTVTTHGAHVALANRAVPIEKRVASVMAVLCGWVCWFGWDFCCAVFCATDAGRSDDWRNYLARWKLGRGKCCRAWVEVFFKIRRSCPSFIQNMTSEIF